MVLGPVTGGGGVEHFVHIHPLCTSTQEYVFEAGDGHTEIMPVSPFA